MIIRRAALYDTSAISNIARCVGVDRSSTRKSGLIELNLDREGYEKRIHGNSFAFLAENHSQKITGFFVGYYSGFLKRLMEIDGHAASDEIMQFVHNLPEPFVYGDQLAVLPGFSGQGVATALYDRTLKEMKERYLTVLYAAVAHAPWRNVEFVDFLAKRGHVLVDETTNSSGLTFGIYEKKL